MKKRACRRGEGTVLLCVLLIVFTLVFSAVAEYSRAAITVRSVKETLQNALDSCIQQEGIREFGRLKNDETESELILRQLLDRFGEGLAAEDGAYLISNGETVICRLSDFRLEQTGLFSWRLSLEAEFPLSFAGAGTLRVPLALQASSYYENKYGE